MRSATCDLRLNGRVLPLALVFCLLCGSSRVRAADDSLPPELDSSISKGLHFLAKQQDSEGWFDGGGPRPGITGLSILAFLSCGNVPEVGKYGLAVRNAVDWLVSQQPADGYFGSGDQGMYTHAVVTLGLAEAYGVEPGADRRARIHAALLKAVAVIVAAQNASKSKPVFVGGWRYQRDSSDSDLSVTGWTILALRAAEEAGIPVPDQVFRQASEFILRCYDAKSGGFGYQPGTDAQISDTAIGMLCVYLLGIADQNAAKLDPSAKFLATHAVDGNTPFAYYAAYYVAQATFQHAGTAWSATGRDLLERLIKVQEKDGGWPQSRTAQEPGRVYATAMALQSLAVPYRLLPIYQR